MLRPALILFLFLTAAPAFAQIAERDLRALSPQSPVKGTLVLQALRSVDDRLELDLDVRMPALFDEIDSQMRGRGNLGDCGARLYWRGPTQMRSGGDTLRLRTRIEGELWVCSSLLKTVLGESTHDADLSLRPVWDSTSRRLSVQIEIDNIRDFPDDLERVLKDNGVPFSRRLNVPLGEGDMLKRLAPSLETHRFARDGNRGVTLSVRLSADRAEAITLLLDDANIDLSRQIGGTAARFGQWLLGTR
ncbi:hypothetical protein [Antarctobacter sp.]|uniref:hypothetical protein n=1 Tax=Antarctobacter sp. TaxID=1872577 RepID=UPI002B2781A1|nr:hypothetical protein [Antarctobacter sp.]